MFFQMLLQSPATINIESRVGEISPLNQFGPTVEGFMRGLLVFAAILAFFYMLWGAVDWIMSQGDTGKVESARKKITHAMIGLAVLASVGAIFMILQTFLGINVVNAPATRVAPPNCRGALCIPEE